MMPMSHPPYSLDLILRVFLFLQMKEVLKGKRFADVKDVKQKMASALKGIKINEFKTILSSGKKCLNRSIASNGECFEGG